MSQLSAPTVRPVQVCRKIVRGLSLAEIIPTSLVHRKYLVPSCIPWTPHTDEMQDGTPVTDAEALKRLHAASKT